MSAKGNIVLMGSGELTSTMVEVHKDMIGRLGPAARAVFLDTPAGFQLNADQISAKAGEYFRDKVGHPMALASYKSKTHAAPFESEKAFIALKQADFVLIGPGSPTYAVRQWTGTPVADILAQRIESGGCLVAASAAALTVGRFTLPVYEIYKVGEDLRWEPGIDILGRFGFNLVVVPHWNNAEGGTHDTRFCFMGEPRFRALETSPSGRCGHSRPRRTHGLHHRPGAQRGAHPGDRQRRPAPCRVGAGAHEKRGRAPGCSPGPVG